MTATPVLAKSTYYHLDLSRPLLFTTTGVDKRGETSYAPINFHEESVNYAGKQAVFFLQKAIPQSHLLNIVQLMATTSLASIHYNNPEAGAATGSAQFENFQKGKRIFDLLHVPQDLRDKMGLSHMHVMYQEFAETAGIIVPGYVHNTRMTEHDKIVSDIEIVPVQDRVGLEAIIRQNKLKGPISFWND